MKLTLFGHYRTVTRVRFAAAHFAPRHVYLQTMPAVAVQISRFVDEHQPGFVECVLLDADGRTHLFVEKVPIVSQLDLRANSEYPCAGAIDCELVSEWQDEFGRLLELSEELSRLQISHRLSERVLEIKLY